MAKLVNWGFLLSLLLMHGGAALAEEMVTIPKDSRIGPKVSAGVRECYESLGGAEGVELMHKYYAQGRDKEEPVLLVFDLGDDSRKMLKGYHLISERGTLYYRHPSEPHFQRSDTKSNVSYVELERIHGFSTAADKEFFTDDFFRRDHLMQFVIQEYPKGAQEFYDEGKPGYKGPFFTTAQWWRSDDVLKRMPAVKAPEGRSAERALVSLLKDRVSSKVDEIVQIIERQSQRPECKEPNYRGIEICFHPLSEITGELSKGLQACLVSKNSELSEHTRKKFGELNLAIANAPKASKASGRVVAEVTRADEFSGLFPSASRGITSLGPKKLVPSPVHTVEQNKAAVPPLCPNCKLK